MLDGAAGVDDVGPGRDASAIPDELNKHVQFLIVDP